jgi:hypothetical protein
MAEKTLQTVIVLRNGSKEAWEAEDSYKLRPGEVGVGYMTVTKGEGEAAVTKQVPIIKVGSDGETAWKDLPQAEGVFEEDQILTYNFGRHTTSNGFVNAGGKGMTTSEWLLDALSVTKDPSITQPSFSMKVKTHNGNTNGTVLGYGIITNTNTAEIGSKVTKIAWDGTFSAGSYEYGSRSGSDLKTIHTDTGTGVTATYEVSCNVVGTISGNTCDGTVTFTEPVVIDGSSNQAIATVTNTCSWGASPRTPVNNVGATKANLKIASGTSGAKTASFSITGFREGFFYGTKSSKTAPADITSAVVRSLSKTGAKYASSAKSVTVPVGAATIILACPATSTGVTKVYNNTVNADMTSSFTKTSNVMVGGADATATSNGDHAVAYNVWTFTPNEAYGTETSLTVTLG